MAEKPRDPRYPEIFGYKILVIEFFFCYDSTKRREFADARLSFASHNDKAIPLFQELVPVRRRRRLSWSRSKRRMPWTCPGARWERFPAWCFRRSPRSLSIHASACRSILMVKERVKDRKWDVRKYATWLPIGRQTLEINADSITLIIHCN